MDTFVSTDDLGRKRAISVCCWASHFLVLCLHSLMFWKPSSWTQTLNCIPSSLANAQRKGVLIFLGWHNKVPQTQSLRTIENCSLTTLESKIWSQGVCRAMFPLKALRKRPSSPFPASGDSGCSLVYGSVTPISIFGSQGLLLLCVSVPNLPLPISIKRYLSLDLGSILNSGKSHFAILYLIISTKTPFPNKFTFTGIWGYNVDIALWTNHSLTVRGSNLL